jgi:hypothetical protein
MSLPRPGLTGLVARWRTSRTSVMTLKERAATPNGLAKHWKDVSISPVQRLFEMAERIKVGQNDPCPCWSGRKYKHCCNGRVDWEHVLRSGQDQTRFMSIRGRNLLFEQAIYEALQLDSPPDDLSLPRYKRAFTADAVRRIYEAVQAIWPPDTPIRSLLERVKADVSGLYIGDYHPHYVARALVRHSIYANKILLVDPFLHPGIIAQKYNPVLHPDQHKAQTLRDVNFFLGCIPWIEAGIVEFIRTPADFDARLFHAALRRARAFGQRPEIRAALDQSVEEAKSRHQQREMIDVFVKSAPDDYLRRIFRESMSGKVTFSEDDFLRTVQQMRDNDPDFLEPLGPDGSRAQLRMMYSGGTYDVARLCAQMSGSYLFTDIKARWTMIELDREGTTAETRAWSPLAKAIQAARLHYLNNLTLDHALQVRQEGRLESLRTLFTEIWDKARGDVPFSDDAATELARKLTDAIREADAEWGNIKSGLVKTIGTAVAAGVAGAGPAVANGHALWLAAAAVIGGASAATWTGIKRAAYLQKHPAAFFMEVDPD